MGQPKVIAYLDASRVTATRQTEPPHGRSRTGYGSKIPSSWLLQLDGKRWHRVYVMCYSNAGTPYVLVKRHRLLLGIYQPEVKYLPSTS